MPLNDHFIVSIIREIQIAHTNVCISGVLCFQTEIAKRLNAICAQIIPFLSQEVSYISLAGGKPVYIVTASV